MKNIPLLAFLAFLAIGYSSSAQAATFTPGNLVIYRVGDGSTALVNTGSAVFLDEYTTLGLLVQSIAVPTSGTNALIASGTGTSEGVLKLSTNGQYLTFTGYNRALGGTGSLSGTTGTAVNRVVGLADASGAVNTSTKLTDFASGNNPRSAITTNGTDIWVGGGAGGVRYTTLGSTTSTNLTTLANVRDVNIFGGQLYVSSGSASGGNTVALGTVGTGLPTTTGQTLTGLPGLPTVATNGNLNDYLILNLTGGSVLYVADNSAGQILKYSLVSGTWLANGSISASGVFNLTGSAVGSTASLFATTGASTATGGGTFYGFSDTTGFNATASGTANVLATLSGTSNEAFRGIAFAPVAVPEPHDFALAVIGLLAVVITVRSRRQARA